ncbi:MAG TPA: DPP IV N-terminal domain-containing protein, partial [Vicinamibacterales bacterium]|nr:DPP IV N-terminal domain-containing protein [Vicinamibacterales bacterium]
MNTTRLALCAAFFAFAAVALTASAVAQDRLKAMPGYEQYQRTSREIPGAVQSGAPQASWRDDGRSLDFRKDGRMFRFDAATRAVSELPPDAGAPAPPPLGRRGLGGAVARGRQATAAESPDKTLVAFYRDRNLFIGDASGGGEVAVTTDGSETGRIKSGTASWVYGEELAQTTAMWWSPDGRRLAYYRFDESRVPDYVLQLDQTKLYSTADVEAYPKAGEPNPVVDLYVYDLAGKSSVRIDVRDGKPFTNDVVGHYVYRVAWSPDGKELLFLRANRRQNVLELAAADPVTGACRVVVREEWPTGWVQTSPATVFLKDGRRFIWASERSGWQNYYLYDLSGRLITPLTRYTTFEAANLVKLDEDAQVVFLMARDGDNFLKLQLHRVGLDGRTDVRLTDPAFHHTVGSCLPGGGGRGGGPPAGGPAACGISADSTLAVDVYQTHDTPPALRVIDAVTGRVVSELAASDTTKFAALGLRKAEMFTYLAADGKTLLRGLVSFPSNFDPSAKYPALAAVYGGPASAAARETFVPPNALCEFGFLVLTLDTRAVPGMGKRALDAIYLKLGQVEIDDMAEGVKALWNRPYFDRDRVGIFGTSYGGYASAMALLRHPDVFRAASASSAVTSWLHYDSIYT